jgi:hypothetical protein
VEKQKLLELFLKTREWRHEHRVNGRSIEAGYAACRECAILDCMVTLGHISVQESIRMEKPEWKP